MLSRRGLFLSALALLVPRRATSPAQEPFVLTREGDWEAPLADSYALHIDTVMAREKLGFNPAWRPVGTYTPIRNEGRRPC